MSFKVEVWGNYAMFTMPEFKTERYSYGVMTPSAAIGILKSVYWNPGIRFVIEKIHVLNPIRYMNMCTNEIENLKVKPNNVISALSKGIPMKSVDPDKNRIQRRNQVLCDVHYVIEAHMEPTRLAKPDTMIGVLERRYMQTVKKGGHASEPYLGIREFTAYIAPCKEIPKCPKRLRGRKELGLMLWDKDYSDRNDIRPQYFNAVLVDGVMRVPFPDSKEVLRYDLSSSSRPTP